MKNLFIMSALFLSSLTTVNASYSACLDRVFDEVMDLNSSAMKTYLSLEGKAQDAEDVGDKVLEKKLVNAKIKIYEQAVNFAVVVCNQEKELDALKI